MYIILPTEQHDQILHCHWLKFRSHDTYITIIFTIKSIKMSVPKDFRHLRGYLDFKLGFVFAE